MARTIRDEILRWTLIVNGDAAKKELNDLNQENKKIAATIKDLEKESRRLERSKETEGQRYKEITAELKQLNSQYSQNKHRIEQLHNELGITGKTMAELRHEAKILRHQLANTVPGTAPYRELEARLAAVNQRMGVLQGKSGSLRASFNNLAEGANKYFNVVAGGIAVLTGVILSIKKLIDFNSELADQEANVMKTTGLTREVVAELRHEFDQWNTRTPRMELLKLAEEAGRLGKSSKHDVMEFVKTANMIKVALGDDLGEAEAIRDIGKLTEQFQIAAKYGVSYGRAMEMIGSAYNEVSASGNNMAPFLVDFSKRIAGIDQSVGLGAANVIGYAAALDEAGQSAETSSTVFNRLLPNMFKDPATYANIAKVSVDEFSNLLKTDANEALLLFLEGLKGNGEGFEVMAKHMESLKLDGARSVSVLAALANNTENVRVRQKTANEALREGVSLVNEYNIKNNNFAANMQKVGRAIYSSIVSSGLVKNLQLAAEWASKFIEVPISTTMENERMKLRQVEMQLLETNLKTEDRVALIKQLKEQYPQYLKDIDADTTSNQALFSAIQSVNDQLINKIILQKQDEKIQDHNEKVAKKRLAVDEQQNKLRAEAIRLAEKQGLSLPAGTDIVDQALKLQGQLKRNEIFAGRLFDPTVNFGIMINDLILMRGALKGLENDNLQMLTEREQLIERLQLKMDQISNPPQVTTDPVNTSETPEEREERIKKEREARDLAHKNTLKQVENFLKGEEAIHAEARAQGLLTAKQYEEGLRMIQVTGFSMRGNTLKAYLSQLGSDEVEKRAEIEGQLIDIRKQAADWEIADIKDFHEWAEQELEKHFQEIDAINEREYDKLKKANAQRRRDSFVGAELDVLKAAPGSSEELEARKRLLDVQRDLELENTQLTELEKEKIIFEAKKRREQLDREYYDNYTQIALQSINAIVASYSGLTNARIQKELDEERQANDVKKQDLRKMLDNKLITEETYRTQLAALEDEFRQKEREYKTNQFKISRAADAVQASINTYLAITRAMATSGPKGAILAGVVGAAQVASILATPIPAFSEGKYPVTTTEGKRYNATYSGPVKTGMYTKPTVGLFAEDGKELIISSPHVKHLEMNYPEIIDAILYSRMPAFARGKYEYSEDKRERRKQVRQDRVIGNSLISINQMNRGQDTMIGYLEEIIEMMREGKDNPKAAEMSWRQYNDFKESAENLEKKYGV